MPADTEPFCIGAGFQEKTPMTEEYLLDLVGPVGVFILKPRTQRAASTVVLREAAGAIQVS